MNDISFSHGGFPVIAKYLFDNLVTETFQNDMLKMKSGYPMNIVEISEKDENGDIIVSGYRLEYALAGFDKKDVHVSIKDNILNILVERKDEIMEDDSVTYLRQGISYKTFDVSYQLMDEIDKGNIKVGFKNGVLCVNLPIKKEKEVAEEYNIEIE